MKKEQVDNIGKIVNKACEITDNITDGIKNTSEVIIDSFKELLKGSGSFVKTEGIAFLKEIINLGRLESIIYLLFYTGIGFANYKMTKYIITTLIELGYFNSLSIVIMLPLIVGTVTMFYCFISIKKLFTPIIAPRIYLVEYFNKLRK